MDKKAEIKKLLHSVSQGQIKDIRNTIKLTFGGALENDVALNMLITISRSINLPELTDSVSEGDWCDLTILCCEHIDRLTNKKTDSFLRALYFVSKYFVEQKFVQSFLRISDYLVPAWVSDHAEFIPLYSYFLILINNEIIIKHSKEMPSEDLLRTCLMSIRIHTYAHTKNPAVLFHRIYSYIYLMKHNPNVSERQSIEFGLEVLELISPLEVVMDREVVDETYRSLLYIANLAVTKDSFGAPDKKGYLHRVFRMVMKLCCLKEFEECTLFLERLLGVLTMDFMLFSDDDEKTLIDSNMALVGLYKKYGATGVLSRTSMHISRVIHTLAQYLEDCDSEVWTKAMKPRVQLELMKLSRTVAMIISSNEVTCNCGDCLSSHDYAQAGSVVRVAGSFVRVSLGHKVTMPGELYEYCLKCLEQCCDYVGKIKEALCEKWTLNWQLVGVQMYNVGSRLYKLNEYEYAHKFYYLFYKNILKLEGTKKTDLCMENALGVAMHMSAICLMHQKLHTRALAQLALLMVVYPAFRETALETWVLIKSKNSDENYISELNINGVLEQNESLLNSLYPDYKYNQKTAEDLLFNEVEFYVKNWPSKLPTNSACREFCKLSKDVERRTKMFASIWETVIGLQDEDFANNLDETIKIIETNKSNASTKIYLSVLYYIKYYVKSYEITKRNLKDMNDAIVPTLENRVSYEDLPNPNDKCDIVPTYYSIKIENKKLLYKMLHRCIELWSEILDKKLSDDLVGELKRFKVCVLIKQVAYEYRLQQFFLPMLKTWNVYLRFGRLLSDSVMQLTALSFIIECTDCSCDEVREMIKQAEILVGELSEGGTIEGEEAVVTYYVNKSKSLMDSRLVDEGFEALCAAENYKLNYKNLSCKLLEARILKLKSCYLSFPCGKKYLDHSNNFLVLAQSSFSEIAGFYKEGGSRCPYTLSILFEIVLHNGWNYKWLRMPREVRCYIKDSTLIAQKFVLPIFTANILILLAFTDSLDGQYDDCEVKLNGLVNILGLGNGCGMAKQEPDDQVEDKVSPLTKDLDNLSLATEQSFETMLNVQTIYKGGTGCSPVLPARPFKLPASASHMMRCDCFYCQNLEYQRVVLETFHLEAQLHKNQSNLALASDYFNGAVTLHSLIKKKYSFWLDELSETLMKKRKNQVFSAAFRDLEFTHCRMLLDYSYYQMKKCSSSVAKTVNDILKIVEREKITNNYFLQEVMVQKLNALALGREKQCVGKRAETNLKVEYNTVMSKTPDSKISVTKVSVSLSPCVELPPIKTVRTIKFDLSDAEDDDDKRTLRPDRPAYYRLQTPGKTPVVSKIKIQTPATINGKRDPPKLSPSVNFLQANQNCDSTTKEKSKKHFEKRSKLLTERLKAEKEKKLLDLAADPQKENVPNRTVCKNLFEELNDAEGRQAVKTRSAANKSPTKVSTPIDRMKRVTRARGKPAPHCSVGDSTVRRSARTLRKE